MATTNQLLVNGQKLEVEWAIRSVFALVRHLFARFCTHWLLLAFLLLVRAWQVWASIFALPSLSLHVPPKDLGGKKSPVRMIHVPAPGPPPEKFCGVASFSKIHMDQGAGKFRTNALQPGTKT